MNITQLTFSPTGGTQRVADIIARALGTSAREIDLTDAGTDFSALSLGKEDVALIAVPSYGGRVPFAGLRRACCQARQFPANCLQIPFRSGDAGIIYPWQPCAPS